MVLLIEILKKSILIVAFLSIGIIFLLFICVKPLQGDIVLNNWKVIEDPSELFNGSPKIGKFYKVIKKNTYVVIESEISTELLKNFERTHLHLYFPQITASYFEIYVDGKVLKIYGDPRTKVGHVWYQPFFITIPKESKNIAIKLYGIYEIGIDFEPFLTVSLVRYNILSFITRVLVPIFMGMALMSAITLFFVSKDIDLSKRKFYFKFFLATIFGVLWMFDLLSIESFGNEFTLLLFRKIFVSSAYFGFAILFSGFIQKNSLVGRIVILLNLIVAISFLTTPTNYYLKTLTSNFSPILVLNSLYLIYKAIKSYSEVLVGFSLFFVLTTINDVLILFNVIQSKFLSPFGITILFSGFAYNLVLEYQILSRKELLAYVRSITDLLTGSFNRGILNDLKLDSSDCLAYVDLNKFKIINDEYGHDVGDLILKKLVSSIRKNIRTSDLIIRMGGDEFLLVFKDCSEEKAKEIMEKCLEDFRNSHELHPTFSYGVKNAGENLNKSIREVDTLMYEMKQKLKNSRE